MIRRRALLAHLSTLTPLAALAQDGGSPGAGTMPVEKLFQRPKFGELRLSPNYRHLAAIVTSGARRQLLAIDVEKRTGTRLTALTDADVDRVFWAGDTRVLYTTGDDTGLDFRTNGGLFAVDVDGQNSRMLVEPAFSGSSLRFVLRWTTPLRRSRSNPGEFLVSANDRSAETQDVYRMNLMTGRKSLLSFSTPGNVERWVLDANETPRVAFSANRRERRWWFSAALDPKGEQWTTLAQWDEQLRDVIIPLAFDGPSATRLFVASNVGRDTLGLFSFDLATRKLGDLIFGDDRYDMFTFGLVDSPMEYRAGGLIFRTGDDGVDRLVGLRYLGAKSEVIWFDEDAARLQASIDASLPGTQNVFDPSGERTLVQARSDTNPGEYYIYSKDRKVLEQTGIRTQPQFDPRDVRPTKSVVWKARDGVPIDGYLTLPARRGDGPVPLILHPHGGPWARDNGYFNPEVQFMADRGFAVLRPNFRGSTGYGANHLRLGYKQWGATMVDDMLDGIDWCIQQGIADPARIGVYGASYGGYAALMALVRRPDLFKWGVNYVGVTDLVVHQDTQPAQLYGGFFNLAQKLTGDQKADAPLFEEYSPARHVAKIAAPVFHAYGGSDMNVAPENGNVIRSAFERAKKPFEWMFVADEAHGYRQDVNVFEFYRHFEKFMLANTPPRRSA